MDIFGGGTQTSGAGFLLPGSRWRSLALTYRVTSYPDPAVISAEDVDQEIREAFRLWSDVTDLTFTKRGYGPVHIEIRFESRAEC